MEGPQKSAERERRQEEPICATSPEDPHKSWPVTLDENGRVQGLPEGKSETDVIVFQGSDGKWHAQNPSPETIAEERLWRLGWQDPIK